MQSVEDTFLFKSLCEENKDYPIPGCTSINIMPVFSNIFTYNYLIQRITNIYMKYDIDLVIGIEGIGFTIASILAHKIKTGIMCITKINSSDIKTINTSKITLSNISDKKIQKIYNKEYGKDILEIDYVNLEYKNILISSGESLNCAIDLLTQLNGNVIECMVLIKENESEMKFKETSKLRILIK